MCVTHKSVQFLLLDSDALCEGVNLLLVVVQLEELLLYLGIHLEGGRGDRESRGGTEGNTRMIVVLYYYMLVPSTHKHITVYLLYT